MTTAKPQPELLDNPLHLRLQQLASKPGGIPPSRALKNAQMELDRLKPQLNSYIKEECANLEAALSAAGVVGPHQRQSIDAAYEASMRLRDVAEPMGFLLVSFIAKNLCEIFEVAAEAEIEYPAAILECHFDALRLVQQRQYRNVQPQDLPELTGGLLRAVELVKGAARQSGQAPSPQANLADAP